MKFLSKAKTLAQRPNVLAFREKIKEYIIQGLAFILVAIFVVVIALIYNKLRGYL